MTCKGHLASLQETLLCNKWKLGCVPERSPCISGSHSGWLCPRGHRAASRRPRDPEAGRKSVRPPAQAQAPHMPLSGRQMLPLQMSPVSRVISGLDLFCYWNYRFKKKEYWFFLTKKKSPQARMWWLTRITTIHNFFQANLVPMTFSNLVFPVENAQS